MFKYIIVIAILLSATISHAEDIKSIEDLQKTLATFKYEKDNGTGLQTPEETFNKKTGDCEDFAYFSHVYLTKLNIKNYFYVLINLDTQKGHAICIFKKRRGGYYYICDNTEISKTPYTHAFKLLKSAFKEYSVAILFKR